MIGRNDLWAVVPVAGSGSRLRPHTYTRPKPLLSVAGQPIIGQILDQLVRFGIKRVDDPRRFGVVVRDGIRVTKLEEKLYEFVSYQAIVGVNYIRDSSHMYRCLDG